jgi:Kef-type K+ transport system membrane component KefB/nucleotide-binding universal stress UspA family protein
MGRVVGAAAGQGPGVPEVIPPLGEHEVVLLLLQLGLLLLAARSLGLLANRFGLPSVVGELLAGVVLGPSLLGNVAPGVFAWVFPREAAQVHLLEVVSLVGVLLLLIVTGLETDLQLIVRKGRNAAAISLFGIAVPFAMGFGLGQVLPGDFIADPEQRLVFSLFLGTALGISAIPVIAKVLIEMGAIRRDIGQITLAAGMIDDTIGWILLSVVAGLARSGVVDLPAVVRSLVSVALVVGLAFTVGRKLVHLAFREVDNRIGGEAVKLTLLLVMALLFGSLTHHLGIEAVLGAFLVGILTGQSRRFDQRSRHILEQVTLAVFAPIFFAASGLRVDLGALADPTVLAVGLLVLAVAILGKFVGAALGARVSGLGRWEALALGAGMNARGAIEIIVATIGLSLGILTPEMFTIVLLVAITTSLMAPPLLRITLRRVPFSDEERRRLDEEDRRAGSVVAGLNRVLIPTRGGGNSRLAARLLATVLDGRTDVEVTTMVVEERQPVAVPAGAAAAEATLVRAPAELAQEVLAAIDEQLATVPPAERRTVVQPPQDDIAEQLLAEARRGYDLLVLGASDEPTPGADTPLFGALVDRLVREAPCPVFVVSNRGTDPDAVGPLRRIVLPVAGAAGERHALEVAMALASSSEAVVEAVNVVEQPRTGGASVEALQMADRIVRGVAAPAHAAGAPVRTHVRTADRPERGILAAATDLRADLIVLAPSLRPLTERAFFGHGVDHILANAPCPVLIVT